MKSTIAIASDHAGFELKAALIKALPHVTWKDLGPANTERVDYPDFAEAACKQVIAGNARFAILICGSGIGMSIAANKFAGIRAALVENPVGAKLSREHNDANVLCLGARLIAAPYAQEIVEAFLNGQASTDPRHQARVKKITALEKQS